MLLKFFKYFRGYVKIKVEGYSPERLLNLCNVHQILLWGVDYKENCYEMYLSIQDYKKMRPLVRKTRTKIILLEKHGLPFFLFKFRKRKTFFAGMLSCVFVICFLSLFVWNIHFEGNVSQKTEELLMYLETINVQHGTFKKEIACEEIETKLRSKYPNILWVSAELRGTRLIVQIKENEDKDIISNLEIKDDTPASIVSNTNGIVEAMIVRKGTPVVKIGEEVSKGQILVEGFYEIKNDAGEILRYEGVPADADIVVLNTETYKDVFTIEYEKKKYTEKKRFGVKLKLFDKIYEFIPKISYKNFDTVKKKREIHITENFYLPLSFEFTWYLEYVPEKGVYTEQEIKKTAMTRFYEKYENILQKGVQIIEKDVKIERNGKLCHVVGTIKLLVSETKKVPAVIPQVTTKASLEGE